MSKFPGLSTMRPLVRAERLIAITAVAITAFGFAQPQVLALAGLSFDRPTLVAVRDIDPMPTGSLARPATPAPALQSTDDVVHGLAGTLKSLRGRN